MIIRKQTHDHQELICKIIDFNVAKFYDSADLLQSPSNKKFKYTMMTETGTLKYRAPEMIKKGNYSEAVDIWSLGCVLYRMVEGKEPFYS